MSSSNQRLEVWSPIPNRQPRIHDPAKRDELDVLSENLIRAGLRRLLRHYFFNPLQKFSMRANPFSMFAMPVA